MAKALLNYTTEVPVDRTVGEIAKALVGHGASSISTEYDKGRPTAVSFTIKAAHGLDAYQLPARVAQVQAVLVKQKLAPRFTTREHAERVAWRIVKDWLEAQLAMIAAGLVDLDEVLLPYQLQNGRTFIDWVRENRKALPGPSAGK